MNTDSNAVATAHPSYLALDRAYLGSAQPGVAEHIATCEVCRLYLESLTNLPVEPTLVASKGSFAQQARSPRSWLLGAVSLAAMACGLLLFVANIKRPVAPAEPYIAAKGFRSVWVYVKRGDATQLWDGKQPFVAGDRVRLKVDPGGYQHIQVYSLTEPDRPTLLFSGPLAPNKIMTLPEAWELDDSAAAERLFVVLSHAPVVPAWEAWSRGKVPPDIAVLPLVLPKRAAPMNSGTY
jgi:hypothetical protein